MERAAADSLSTQAWFARRAGPCSLRYLMHWGEWLREGASITTLPEGPDIKTGRTKLSLARAWVALPRATSLVGLTLALALITASTPRQLTVSTFLVRL